jgi:hypothetical protein
MRIFVHGSFRFWEHWQRFMGTTETNVFCLLVVSNSRVVQAPWGPKSVFFNNFWPQAKKRQFFVAFITTSQNLQFTTISLKFCHTPQNLPITAINRNFFHFLSYSVGVSLSLLYFFVFFLSRTAHLGQHLGQNFRQIGEKLDKRLNKLECGDILHQKYKFSCRFGVRIN